MIGLFFFFFFDGGFVFFEFFVLVFEVDGVEKIKKFNGIKLILKKIVYVFVLYSYNE